MVALAELTKIPVGDPVVLGLLALEASSSAVPDCSCRHHFRNRRIIGLERAATLRQLKYDELAKQITILKSEHQNLESTILQAQKENLVGASTKEY